jgi:hypothetical protein
VDWVYLVVIALILIAFAIGFMFEFPAGEDLSQPRPEPRICPTCNVEMRRLGTTPASRWNLGCPQCGQEFREREDGTLTRDPAS